MSALQLIGNDQAFIRSIGSIHIFSDCPPPLFPEFSYNHSGHRVKMKESWRSQWLKWTDGMTLYNHSSEPINVALQGKNVDDSRPRTASPVTIAARSSGQLSFPYNADSNCAIRLAGLKPDLGG